MFYVKLMFIGFSILLTIFMYKMNTNKESSLLKVLSLMVIVGLIVFAIYIQRFFNF